MKQLKLLKKSVAHRTVYRGEDRWIAVGAWAVRLCALRSDQAAALMSEDGLKAWLPASAVLRDRDVAQDMERILEQDERPEVLVPTGITVDDGRTRWTAYSNHKDMVRWINQDFVYLLRGQSLYAPAEGHCAMVSKDHSVVIMPGSDTVSADMAHKVRDLAEHLSEQLVPA